MENKKFLAITHEYMTKHSAHKNLSYKVNIVSECKR